VLDAVSGVREAAARDGITEVTVTAEKGGRVRRAQASYDRLGYAIATGGSADEVTRRLTAAARAVSFDITP
jgi:hypothetical protein